MSLSTRRGPDSASVSVLDGKDRRILDLLQREFPVCRSPYREIAKRFGMGEREAQERVKALRKRGLIRRIGAVLNSRRLGLSGTLVAMKVPQGRLDEVANVVNALPNVTHNYLREHDYNMWFTVTAESPQRLAEIVARLKRATGITEVLELPTLRTFKVNVRLEFNKDG